MDFVGLRRHLKICQVAPSLAIERDMDGHDAEILRAWANEHISFFAIDPITDEELTNLQTAVVFFASKLKVTPGGGDKASI